MKLSDYDEWASVSAYDKGGIEPFNQGFFTFWIWIPIYDGKDALGVCMMGSEL